MKTITPNIAMDNCEAGLKYYQGIFGGELKEYNKTPDGKVMHAELHVNERCVIYFQDLFNATTKGDTVGFVLEMDSEQEIRALYDALVPGSTVRMALQKTFWGALHASVQDRNGVIWSLNYTF